jgi:hypothetical protein
MFQPIWPSSGVKIFLMRKLLSCVVNIYPEHSGTRYTAKHTARKNTTHQLQHTSTSKGPAYILSIEDGSFLIKKILTPDDDHIG